MAEDNHLTLFNMPLHPCACACEDGLTNDPLCIMWVRSQVSTDGEPASINHIVPLVPGSGCSFLYSTLYKAVIIFATGRAQPTMASRCDVVQVVSQYCLRKKIDYCCVEELECSAQDCDWVQCDRCEGWYHSICIGVCSIFFENEEFVCCKSQAEQLQAATSL